MDPSTKAQVRKEAATKINLGEAVDLMITIDQKRKQVFEKRSAKLEMVGQNKDPSLDLKISHVFSDVKHVLSNAQRLVEKKDDLKMLSCCLVKGHLRSNEEEVQIRAGSSKESAESLKSSLQVLMSTDLDPTRLVQDFRDCKKFEAEARQNYTKAVVDTTQIQTNLSLVEKKVAACLENGIKDSTNKRSKKGI